MYRIPFLSKWLLSITTAVAGSFFGLSVFLLNPNLAKTLPEIRKNRSVVFYIS